MRQAAELACVANRRGTPPDELAESIWASQLTRRALLQASVAVGAGAVVADEADRPPPARRSVPRIAIVGAGIAGLRTAFELKRNGIRAQVYEAGPRIGGRIWSVKDLVGPGFVSDLGGEFIDSHHGDMRALVQAFGLELLDTRADLSPKLAREAYFFGGRHYAEAQTIEAFRPLAARIEDDAEGLGPPQRYRRNPEAIALDRLSIAEYLDDLDASGWVRKLIEVAFAAEYGLDCDRLSAIDLVNLIATNPENERLEIYGESDERYKVRGGSGQVVAALGRRVEGQVTFEHRLESVRSTGDAIRLDFAGPGGRSVAVVADFAVVTLPFSVLRKVDLRIELPPLKRRAIAELSYGTNTKLVAGFRHRVWRERGYAGSIFSDEPFATAWDNTRLQPGEAGGMTLFAGGRAGLELAQETAAAQLARRLPGLERAYPGVGDAYNGKTDRYCWPTAPLALGSYACYTTGQWTSFAGVEGARVGNLYFAGEHCHFGDSGYMNSAAASGRKAAEALLARLSVR